MQNNSPWLTAIFPIILIFTNFIRLTKTFWSARKLNNGNWSDYNRFRASNGINSLCYWTQALNFDRFGRKGISPYVGTGKYKLGDDWWPCSLTSYYLSWRLGAVFPFFCMLGWIFSHFLWIELNNFNPLWFAATIALALISTYFYGSAFVFLNYNGLGWLFMPTGIFGLITGNYFLAGFAWFLASLGSLTVVFIAGFLCIAWTIYTQETIPLLTILPAVLKLATHFLYTTNLKQSILSVISSLGLNNYSKSEVKYKRSKNSEIRTSRSHYFLFTWFLFTLTLVHQSSFGFAIMCVTILLLWLANSTFFRFADPQSLYLSMFSVATAALIVSPSFLLILLYWFGISPPPRMIGASSITEPALWPPSYKPFNIRVLINKAHEFLSKVNEGSRVFLALDNPKGRYERIFDGYRILYELAFYTGNLRKLLVFPDWWAIFENNKISSPDFWGREPHEVLVNLKLWNADHIIVYQNTGSCLEKKWLNNQFVELAQFDWGPLWEKELEGDLCWGSHQPAPKWFLLKRPGKLEEKTSD